MALAIIHSRALDGMHAPAVNVEVHLANGLPSFTLVGLPDAEVREARDRVRAAIVNSGFEFPQRRITVNLAPADLPKESGRFDLPIALALLAASGQVSHDNLEDYEFAGELSLSGMLRPIRGALAMALACAQNSKRFILPHESASEAALAGGATVLAASSLLEVSAHLNDQSQLTEATPRIASHPCFAYPDMADVRGQAQAKRALEIAAAGAHSLLMAGPPGSGKSMLASRLPGIIPELDLESARASAAVLSLNGHFRTAEFRHRPFRSPHHTASAVALVGGGNPPRPGEISLAHKGVLFLDELVEFDRRVLETLREPLESGTIHIARAGRQAQFPAEFQLVAAMNPCPCGWHGHPGGKCRCSPNEVQRYRGRISGPLLDRVDLQIEVPALSPEVLQGPAQSENSGKVRERVRHARRIQNDRQGKTNAHLSSSEVEAYCLPETSGATFLKQAMQRLDLSARAYHRILRTARSIADLDAVNNIQMAHVAEAVQYRRFTRH